MQPANNNGTISYAIPINSPGSKAISNSSVSCKACKKNKKCSVVHGACKLCDGCFVESVMVSRKCMLCKNQMTTGTYAGKLSGLNLKCEYCAINVKYTNAKIRECGCIACGSCFTAHKQYNVCRKCGREEII